MSDYREVHEQAREHGLKARHETRVERAIRRQVAEEIAVALEARAAEWETPWPIPEGWDSHHITVRGASQTATTNAARIAREIGSKEHSNQATEETK